MDSISFKDQVVIVTGAGGGIGRAYALEIAKRGAAVVVNDLGGSVDGVGASSNMADAVVAEIEANGGSAVANYDSVATTQGAKGIVASAIENFGRVDALINNAGNMRADWFEQSSKEDFESLLSVHLLGSYNVAKEVWPHMKQRAYGRIVFTASSAGMFGNPMNCTYGAAKAGVAGLMNVLSNEGKPHGILCNAVMPNAHSRMSAAVAEDMDPQELESRAPMLKLLGNSMEPDFNTGIAVYLASNACNDSHALYSACAGRIARVFIGVTEGWQGSREVPSTAEDVAAHIEQIRSLEQGVHIPESPADEYRNILLKT